MLLTQLLLVSTSCFFMNTLSIFLDLSCHLTYRIRILFEVKRSDPDHGPDLHHLLNYFQEGRCVDQRAGSDTEVARAGAGGVPAENGGRLGQRWYLHHPRHSAN